jgi:NADPH2:quinone reductase
MKAIRVHKLGPPEVMRVEEIPDVVPDTGQVVLRVHAAGVNPVDTYLRAGLQGYSPTVPYTPGLDAAGVIERIGEGVTRCRVGDRVYSAGTISGAYAEKALCHESQIFPLPDSLTFEQGAAIPVPYATAYRALFQRGRAIPGEAVLVHGASGGVGLASIQFARAAGLTVIGTAGTKKGQTLIAEQGAHFVLDHSKPDYLEEIFPLTNGNGVDLILEMLANVNLDKDLKALAHHGRVVVVGSRGSVEITPRDLMSRDGEILGVYLGNATERERRSINAAITAGLKNGTLRPVVGKSMPLADASKAHREIIETRAYGKIVLIP